MISHIRSLSYRLARRSPLVPSRSPTAVRIPKRAIVVAVSVALVVLAFLVPETVGAVFAGLGLTGLFAVRVSMMGGRRPGMSIIPDAWAR